MSRRRTITRIGAALWLLTALVVGVAAPAAAHVDLLESTPADQAQLDESPDVLELVFSAPVTAAGDGIQLVDRSGAVVDAAVSQPSDERFLLSPTDPLDAGTYGVLWTVRAGDAHPRSGSIAFKAAPSPAPTESSSPGPQPPATLSTATADEIVIAAASVAPATSSGDWLARIGRWVALTGALAAIGTLAFAAFALTGSRSEVREAAFWVRRAALAIIAGSMLEAFGMSIALHGSLSTGLSPSGLASTLASSFGVASMLRIVGGLAVLIGAQPAATPLATIEPSLPEPAPPTGTVATLARPRPVEVPHQLDMAQSSIAVAGVVAVVAAYLFDGHTVTATPVWLVRTADVVHVAAAGVWVGGVLTMGWVLTQRRRRGAPLRAAELAVRFSPIAAVALAAASAAGLALTWMILDTPGELVSTDWGRTLIAKLLVVGVAAAMGGYNHRNVVPQLAANADDEPVEHMLRIVVRIEGAVLISVIAVTAVLVGAAS